MKYIKENIETFFEACRNTKPNPYSDHDGDNFNTTNPRKSEEKQLADDLTEHLRESARGGLILVVGQIASTLIAAVGSILVARFLGSVSYGEIAIALIPISLASLFNDIGVCGGLTKYIAQYRAENREGDLTVLIRAGLLINTAASLFLFLITFLSSGILASRVFNQPRIRLLIQVSSLSIIAQSLITTTRSIFVGFERMEFVSSTVIVQSILRSMLAPLLVFIGLGSLGAVIGYTSTHVITGILGIAILLLLLKKLTSNEPAMNYREGFPLLLSYGYPLFLTKIVAGALTQVYGLLMAVHANPFDIGNYRAATNFSVIVTFFTMPFATVLFPLFSKLNHQREGSLAPVFQNAVKYSALITVPVTLALMLLSEPMVQIIYGDSYPKTAFFVKLFLINYLFIGLGRHTILNLLNGQGETRVTFQRNVLNLCVGIPLSLYLIPKFGIVGMLLTMIIVPQAGLFYGLWWTNKNFGFTIEWKTSAKIYISSASSYLVSYFILMNLRLGDWPEILLGGGLFILMYLIMIYALRTMELDDIQNLRRILGAMGPLTPIFNIFLTLFEKILKKQSDSS